MEFNKDEVLQRLLENPPDEPVAKPRKKKLRKGTPRQSLSGNVVDGDVPAYHDGSAGMGDADMANAPDAISPAMRQICVGDSTQHRYPWGERIFKPNWSLKESESISSETLSATKFMDGFITPADQQICDEVADDALDVQVALAMGRALCLVREQSGRKKKIVQERAKDAEVMMKTKEMNDKLSRDIDRLTTDLGDLKTAGDEYELKIAGMQDAYGKIEQKNKSLRRDNRRLKKDKGALKHKYDNFYRSQTLQLHGTYEMGYDDCKGAIGVAHPNLDLSGFKSRFSAAKAPVKALPVDDRGSDDDDDDDDEDGDEDGDEGDEEDDAQQLERRSKSAHDRIDPTGDA